MATSVIHNYQPIAYRRVRGSLGKFFRYVFQTERIDTLDQIRPSTVTRFIAAECQLGIRNQIIIGHISMFFAWAIYEQRCDCGNPVVRRMHRELFERASEADKSREEGNTDVS
jgi:hypothetical protein